MSTLCKLWHVDVSRPNACFVNVSNDVLLHYALHPASLLQFLAARKAIDAQQRWILKWSCAKTDLFKLCSVLCFISPAWQARLHTYIAAWCNYHGHVSILLVAFCSAWLSGCHACSFSEYINSAIDFGCSILITSCFVYRVIIAIAVAQCQNAIANISSRHLVLYVQIGYIYTSFMTLTYIVLAVDILLSSVRTCCAFVWNACQW